MCAYGRSIYIYLFIYTFIFDKDFKILHTFFLFIHMYHSLFLCYLENVGSYISGTEHVPMDVHQEGKKVKQIISCSCFNTSVAAAHLISFSS